MLYIYALLYKKERLRPRKCSVKNYTFLYRKQLLKVCVHVIILARLRSLRDKIRN